MRINRLQSPLITYTARPQIKGLADNSSVHNAALKPASISPAFYGLPFRRISNEIGLPLLITKTNGEVYAIKIFDKMQNKRVKVFLKYSDFVMTGINGPVDKPVDGIAFYDGYKDLSIYSQEGEKIGGTYLNFSHWRDHGLHHNHVRLHDLANDGKERYAGVGSALIQAAVEQSLKTNAKGKIYVCACNVINRKNDPFIFYQKMGLSVIDPRSNSADISKYIDALSESEFIALQKRLEGKNPKKLSPDDYMKEVYESLAEIRGVKPDEVHLHFQEYMYLPDSKVKEFWLPKIEKNPILCDTNRIYSKIREPIEIIIPDSKTAEDVK